MHEREIKISWNIGDAREVDRTAFLAALEAALADGPRPQKELGLALAETFPEHPATALGQLARSAAPLVQVPPRGTWKGPGAVVYERADRWTGHPLDPPAAEDVVLRYLRSHGPATAADVTAWSAVTGIAPVVKAMAADGRLERHEDEAGKPLYDAPGGELAEEDEHAPVRLLGRYDNVWLSHAKPRPGDRPRGPGRVERPQWRHRACTVFADGYLVGLWQADGEGGLDVLETLRPLTRDRAPGAGRGDRAGAGAARVVISASAACGSAALRRRPGRRWRCGAPRPRGAPTGRRRRRTWRPRRR